MFIEVVRQRSEEALYSPVSSHEDGVFEGYMKSLYLSITVYLQSFSGVIEGANGHTSFVTNSVGRASSFDSVSREASEKRVRRVS